MDDRRALSIDYNVLWTQVESLPWCGLVTTGRTGTDFFQSLMDSHPEVFVFNGVLYFHTFWKSSRCVRAAAEPDLGDLIAEFVGAHIKSFKSRYDVMERKDRLGEERDRSIDIDLDRFKDHVTGLLQGRPVTVRNFLTAVYVAYELCLGRDLARKKLFLHHLHHVRKVADFMADFPAAKVICMTRDPRALYVSGVENWRRYDTATDVPSYPLYILWRAIDEIAPLRACDDGRLRVLRLEDLGNDETLAEVCEWLGVSFHSCMKEATWAGMRWWGDEVSQNRIPENERGFSRTMATNKWEQRLGAVEKALLNYLLVDIFAWYGYPHRRRDGIPTALLMALAILLPTRYERRYLSPGYLGKALAAGNPRKFLAGFYHTLRRIAYSYGLFYRRNFGSFFLAPHFGPGHRPGP